MTTETKALIGILAVTIAIIIGGALLVAQPGDPTPVVVDPERLVRADDPVLGSADVAVTVVEFGDFECPACGALHPLLKQIKDANRDSVRFVYRHFPLPQHPHATLAAEAAAAAQQQGKFWEYHDLLFEHQNELERSHLEGYAQQLGLDLDAFKRALEEHTYQEAVDQDRRDGVALRVTSTPSVFINGVLFNGQYSVSALQAAIDAAGAGSPASGGDNQ